MNNQYYPELNQRIRILPLQSESPGAHTVDYTPQQVLSASGGRNTGPPLPTPPRSVDIEFKSSYNMASNSSQIPTPNTIDNSPNRTSTGEEGAKEQAHSAGSKPKRVRTGCLTCRERHLKCDEGAPICQNCKKSSRQCKRGVRLNFIDIKVEQPPTLLPPTHDFKIVFEDNSREIASEYKGGVEKYAALEPDRKRRRLTPPEPDYDYAQVPQTVMHPQPIPAQPTYPAYPDTGAQIYAPPPPQQAYDDHASVMAQTYNEQHRQSYDQQMMMQPPAIEEPVQPLASREEVLYMQVFVEEVAVWMDSMDRDKHFSRLLPFQSLKEPMLKCALLACGVRHLTLVNPAYPEEHALSYYNQANVMLLKSLQNPNRDTVLCATTATVLNVYEIMSERALQRMNHIAGARALIKECRWDGAATGIGAACFWLNIGLELFSCLHFNWSVAWDPDTWGIDMKMDVQPMGGNEEGWTHRVLWILAKVTNFRSSMPRFSDSSIHAEQLRLQSRYQQWLGLKQFCERWEKCIPPTMQPMAVVPMYMTATKSAFPEVWYIKRTTVVARLFWHTALCLLAQIHPMASSTPQLDQEMQETGLYHARQICGIIAHVKDRGVASASIRCLAVAAEFLKVQREQEEVLEIFERIKKETGWRVAFINEELKEKWGWNTPDVQSNPSTFFGAQGMAPTMPTPVKSAPRQKPPSGIVNPVYKHADFNAPNPPYKGTYVPPAPGYLGTGYGMGGFAGIPAI